MELGDILFTLTNIARFAGVDPEASLIKSTDKFEKRFRFMEKKFEKTGKCIDSASKDEMEKHWNLAKETVG